MLQKTALALLLGAILVLARASAEDKAKPSDAAPKEIEKNGVHFVLSANTDQVFRKYVVSDTSVSAQLKEELDRYGKVVFGTSGTKIKEVPSIFYVPNDLWKTVYEKKIIMEDDSFFLTSKGDKIVLYEASSDANISDSPKDDKDKYRDTAWKKVKAAIDELGLEIVKPQPDKLTFNSASVVHNMVACWSYVDKKTYKSAKYGDILCMLSPTSIRVSLAGDRILEIVDVPKTCPERESVKSTEKEIREFAEKSFPDLQHYTISATLVVNDEQRDVFTLDHPPRKPYLMWNVVWMKNSRWVANAFIDAESQKLIEFIDMRTL